MLSPTMLETNLHLLLLTFCLSVWGATQASYWHFQAVYLERKGFPSLTSFLTAFFSESPNVPIFFKAEMEKRSCKLILMDFLWSGGSESSLTEIIYLIVYRESKVSYCVTEQKCIKLSQLKIDVPPPPPSSSRQASQRQRFLHSQ